MKTWKCTVCGYIQSSEEPPEKCPVCGADRSKFIEVFPDKPESVPEFGTKETVRESGKLPFLQIYENVTELMSEYHIHPISVHIPNGVLPVSVIFVILAVVFQFIGFAAPAFYNLVFVLLSMPLVLFSGYNDWKRIYGAQMTNLFFTKMVCGGVVTATCFILVLWRIFNPNVMYRSETRWIFLFIHLIMLGAAGLAGHLGGNLVFGKRKK